MFAIVFFFIVSVICIIAAMAAFECAGDAVFDDHRPFYRKAGIYLAIVACLGFIYVGGVVSDLLRVLQ